MSRLLPSKWAMTTFDLVGEYTDYVANGSFASLKENVIQTDVEDYAILVRLRDQTKKWKGPFRYVTKESFEFLSKSELKPGDLFLVNVGAPGKTFLVPDLGKPMTIAPNGIRVRASKASTNSYLNYYFSSATAQDNLKSITAGNAQQKFNKTDLKKTELPLPPLNEQFRITNKLDSLFAKVEAAQTRLEKIPILLKRFHQSVLAAATSGELTREWRAGTGFDLQIKTLGETGTVIKTGPFGSALHKRDYVEGKIPIINPMHINDGKLTPSNSMTISDEKYLELSAWHLREGDVIVGRRGEMGRAAVVKEGDKKMLCGTGSMILRGDDKVLPKYLELILRSPISVEYFTAASVGSTMVNLNQGVIKKLKVHFPPIQEQKEIVSRVEALFSRAESVEKYYRKAKEETDRLTQSLLVKAFRGELVPQDINDEAASKLLKRIQAEREELKSLTKKRQKKE